MGTLIGAAVLAVLANGLTILQMPSFMQNIITGGIINTCCCDPEDRCWKKIDRKIITIPPWTDRAEKCAEILQDE